MKTQIVVFEQDNKQVIQEGSKFFTRVFENGENFESQDFNTIEKAKLHLSIAPTTQENNKLIAEFMRLDISKRNPNTILYHSDWNWLMEVVEKIEEYNYSATLFIIEDERCHLNIQNGFEIDSVGHTKIQAVYNACIEFVKWYNNKTN